MFFVTYHYVCSLGSGLVILARRKVSGNKRALYLSLVVITLVAGKHTTLGSAYSNLSSYSSQVRLG